MINSLFGTKITQTYTFTPEGKRIPITLVKLEPMSVINHKELTKDGYSALQLGIGQKRVKNVSKAVLGHLKKSGLDKNPPRFLREVKLTGELEEDIQNFKLGEKLEPSEILKKGDILEVMGISKGKGFQGVVKRHHFKGGPRTHGQSDRERGPGSIGQTTTPGRVYKGKRMAGRMGGERVTIKNLKVIDIDKEKNTIMISGLVPGGSNSLLMLKKL